MSTDTLTVIISIIIMFLWLRTEANADRRHISGVQKEDRNDILEMIGAIKEDVKAMQLEMKDFHNRLCMIEERNKGK